MQFLGKHIYKQVLESYNYETRSVTIITTSIKSWNINAETVLLLADKDWAGLTVIKLYLQNLCSEQQIPYFDNSFWSWVC